MPSVDNVSTSVALIFLFIPLVLWLMPNLGRLGAKIYIQHFSWMGGPIYILNKYLHLWRIG